MQVSEMTNSDLASIVFFFSSLGSLFTGGLIIALKKISKFSDEHYDKLRTEQLRKELDNYFKERGEK